MKAFIFDPLWYELVTDEIPKLNKSGLEVIVKDEIAPLSECKELFEGDEERILCLNPDYVSFKLSPDDYKDIPNLKAILVASTSFGWLDDSYAKEKGIPVCNIRGFSAEAVAEYAIMMMLNVARKTPSLIKDGFPLDFGMDFIKYKGIELHGKKAGIIGLGSIGSSIAERCLGLGLEVSYWSLNSRNDKYKYEELDKLVAESDVIFPTLASNDETKKLLTPDLLAKMKSSAMLISIEHHLFDVKTVLDMVKNNKLYGFGFETDPESFDKFEGNVWAAPPYGWATDGTFDNLMNAWIDNMVNAAQGKFPNKVN